MAVSHKEQAKIDDFRIFLNKSGKKTGRILGTTGKSRRLTYGNYSLPGS